MLLLLLQSDFGHSSRITETARLSDLTGAAFFSNCCSDIAAMAPFHSEKATQAIPISPIKPIAMQSQCRVGGVFGTHLSQKVGSEDSTHPTTSYSTASASPDQFTLTGRVETGSRRI